MDLDLKTGLDEAGLSRVSDLIFSLAKMSIRFTTIKPDGKEIPVGASKVGGNPDLPPGVSFPKWKKSSLAFLAQINLADTANFSAASVLPSSGLLSFFYTAAQDAWGFDPKQKDGWRVFYFADVQHLRRLEFPSDLPVEGRYQACAVSFFEELTLPSLESQFTGRLELDRAEERAYVHFLTKLDESMDRGGMCNRILGHPDQIQGDMLLECQMASNGIYCGDGRLRQHPRYHELQPGSLDWNLLLQLDSEEKNAKMMWGDVGRVYYWIHKTALENREFDRVWFQFQCC